MSVDASPPLFDPDRRHEVDEIQMKQMRPAYSTPSTTSNSSETTTPPPERAIDSLVVPVAHYSSIGSLTIRVKDGFLLAYGEVGNIIVRVRVKIVESYIEARTQAFKIVEMLRGASDTYKAYLGEKVVLLKLKVSDVSFQTQAMVVESYDASRARAIVGYRVVHDKAQACIESATCKALESYAMAQATIAKIPVPLSVKNSFLYVQSQVGVFVVRVRKNTVIIYGQVKGAVIRIRSQLVGTVDASIATLKLKANEIASRVMRVVDPYIVKTEKGLTAMRCKVGNAVVYINARVDKAKEFSNSSLVEVKRAVVQLPLTKQIMYGVNVLQTKLGEVFVYCQNGYMHIAAKVGDQVVYIHAKVIEKNGEAKIIILERYCGAKEIILSVANIAAEKAAHTAQFAQAQLRAALEKSKAIAADKPIASSAASGAMMVGASGGALGLVSGSLVGAACGVPLALFSFGLSIPIGACIGGGTGAAIGTTAGGAAGAAAGGAAGYGYKNRTKIKTGVESAVAKASSLRVLGKGLEAKVGSGTGGTI